jgi:hypothetical protein
MASGRGGETGGFVGLVLRKRARLVFFLWS